MRVQIVADDESFEFTPDGCEPSVFVLRRLTNEAVEEIDHRYRRKEFNKRTRSYEHVIPPEAGPDRAADLYDYVIRDWREVEHPVTRALLPCTREWKARLPGSVKIAIMERADEANVAGLRTDADGAADPTRR